MRIREIYTDQALEYYFQIVSWLEPDERIQSKIILHFQT